MSETIQVGIVGCWRYLIRPGGRGGVFVVARRDVPNDFLEDDLAVCCSLEVAELVAGEVVAHARRKLVVGGDIYRSNFHSSVFAPC